MTHSASQALGRETQIVDEAMIQSSVDIDVEDDFPDMDVPAGHESEQQASKEHLGRHYRCG